jgi:hypothetical protein
MRPENVSIDGRCFSRYYSIYICRKKAILDVMMMMIIIIILCKCTYFTFSLLNDNLTLLSFLLLLLSLSLSSLLIGNFDFYYFYRYHQYSNLINYLVFVLCMCFFYSSSLCNWPFDQVSMEIYKN